MWLIPPKSLKAYQFVAGPVILEMLALGCPSLAAEQTWLGQVLISAFDPVDQVDD
jgi:hypothetical protein